MCWIHTFVLKQFNYFNKKIMSMMSKVFGTVAIAACTSIATFAVAKKYIYSDTPLPNTEAGSLFAKASYEAPVNNGGYVSLEAAAEKASKCVVHINIKKAGQIITTNPFGNDDFFGQFFSQRYYQPEQKGSGSGVIISSDGYIVTNNHVVENVTEVTVTLNDKQEKAARVIATDPSTDLALVKIEANNLPFISYGNSDNVRLAEWVLAVGYPLDLQTTVTAGIISAKSRSLGLHEKKNQGTQEFSAIESFLQTDAAINPGNSGGALVNANGELIGINTAIASPTGSYAGYGYAIPSNLVKKVIEDLKKYGEVQRAVLGIQFVDQRSLTPEKASAIGLDKIDGILVGSVNEGGGADAAGLKQGDIVTKIEAQKVATIPQLLELIGRYHPGDKVTVTYMRNGKELTSNVTLKNVNGNTDIIKRDNVGKLGFKLKQLSAAEAKAMGIQRGLQITEITNAKVAQQTKIKKGFVITQIDETDVASIEDFNRRINQNTEGQVTLSGVYPNYRGLYYYSVDIGN
jgi:serine protease Do